MADGYDGHTVQRFCDEKRFIMSSVEKWRNGKVKKSGNRCYYLHTKRLVPSFFEVKA